MERTKRQFIEELLVTAQDNVWKNQLAYDYNEEFAVEGKEKDEKKQATSHAIDRDLEYIEFLKKQLILNK